MIKCNVTALYLRSVHLCGLSHHNRHLYTTDYTERNPCLSALCCSCHVCGFQTELNAQFVSHMSLHVDKEQWMFSLCCTSCDYVSVDESDIKSHIAAEHSGKRRTRNPTTSHQ